MVSEELLEAYLVEKIAAMRRARQLYSEFVDADGTVRLVRFTEPDEKEPITKA